ncbi:MAG: DMT family transporter [Actinomycetota bacterium]|nr:DMT family transporter [Actinomycetota bacterium]MDQ3901729.1 DMT family transporter [Actinomycetota bacterium]
MTLAIVLSLTAAVCFGTASVLQHQGANRVRRRFPLNPGLLVAVARQRLWLLGIAAEVTAVALHMVAVNLGALSVVQPLLTVGLVVALPMQALLGLPVRKRALLAAALTVGGLAVFLVVQPTVESRDPQSITEWLPGLILVALVACAALVVALTRQGRARSLGLGAAAGSMFALSAALVKTWGEILGGGGLPALISSWELWTALSAGLVGALLSQAAFQSGPLGGPLAAQMVVDPVIGVSLGGIVFGESFATGVLAVAQAAGFAITLAGVWLLATGEQRDPGAGRASAHAPRDRTLQSEDLHPGLPG